MTKKQDFYEIIDTVHLIPLSQGFRINDFECEIEEYKMYLQCNALESQEMNISKVHLLINEQNADIISYMVLVTDSIPLSDNEKNLHQMECIPYGAFPSLKIAKLAVDKNYKNKYKGIGSFMIELARGMAYDINELGVACRFLTIDADIEHNATVTDFYYKNGFVENEKHKKRTKTLSMRLDIFS